MSDTAVCRHCGREIWWMGDYQKWVHADSWVHVCDMSTHRPLAEPVDEAGGSSRV